jgi:hypothetical protein
MALGLLVLLPILLNPQQSTTAGIPFWLERSMDSWRALWTTLGTFVLSLRGEQLDLGILWQTVTEKWTTWTGASTQWLISGAVAFAATFYVLLSWRSSEALGGAEDAPA